MKRVGLGLGVVAAVAWWLSVVPASAAAVPDVAVSNTADPATLNPGETIGFDVTISNSNAGGTGAAINVASTDMLPAHNLSSLWSLDSQSSGNYCSIGQVGTSQVVTCNIASLAPGASVAYHISSPNALACSTDTHTVSVTVGNEAGGPFTATASSTVLCPRLTANVTADAATVSAGSPVGFTVTFDNAGPDIAVNAPLSIGAPTGMSLTWNTSAAWTKSCTVEAVTASAGQPPSYRYQCTIPTLDPGGSNDVIARLTAVPPSTACGTTYTVYASTGYAISAIAVSSAATAVQCVASNVLGTSVPVPTTGAMTPAAVVAALALTFAGALVAGAFGLHKLFTGGRRRRDRS